MANLKENIKSLLKDLTHINAGVGQEQPVISYIMSALKGEVDELKVDHNGNVHAIKRGHKEGLTMMVAAHTDEIGLIVKNILPNGFLLIEKLGGVPDNMLLGRKVYVGKNNLPGVIGTKPGHLQTAEEAKRVKTVAECYVDMALPSREAVEAHGVSVGDQVIISGEFTEMVDPDYISMKAIDDRLGCSILIELLKNLSKQDFAGTLHGVFTVQEEVGLYGAQKVGDGYTPDYAIVLDTIPAGDTPDVNTERDLPVRLGAGPALPLADAVMPIFFSMVHPAVRRAIEKQATTQNIHLQKLTLLGGGYTTDSAKLSHAGGGIPCATLAIPRRYSHSPIELTNLNDSVDVYNILQGLIRDNENMNTAFI
ncbi:hydrolase [Ignatzschineria sp. F8392]|uniref:M42 family metallopeptidase n=1 Tax=Ignatzschineria sp. F8392 TaxID=1980117 RepID=UPI000B9862FF|nr:M20/M25/M40 family metallo-hydrolase [Ignatzschineria sp. F8392]OYQ81357.1 hydrolase [Ignatzschineria sp. F8392]